MNALRAGTVVVIRPRAGRAGARIMPTGGTGRIVKWVLGGYVLVDVHDGTTVLISRRRIDATHQSGPVVDHRGEQ